MRVWRAGQEIWEQTGGRLDAFVSGAGTGGTIAGVSCHLKQQRPEVQVFLIDPPGSSLYNKVSRMPAGTAEGRQRGWACCCEAAVPARSHQWLDCREPCVAFVVRCLCPSAACRHHPNAGGLLLHDC